MPKRNIAALVAETMSQRLQEHRDSNNKLVIDNKEQGDTLNDGYKHSRIERAYADGYMPPEHKRVYDGLKAALDGRTEGEIILQHVLNSIGMLRPSVLKIIRHLVHYGYLRYKPQKKKVFVSILK